PMWIMYCCVAAVGIVCAAFVRRKVLTSEHEETKTGMEAEKANAAQRAAERDERHAQRESKRHSKRASHTNLAGSRGGSRPTTAHTDEVPPPMPSMSTEKFVDAQQARGTASTGLESDNH
ncbi:hypothetical protein B0A54_08950, partial [Friedmanniomyces endolithicus]